MSSEPETVGNTFQDAENDLRLRFSDIASKVGADVQEATNALCNTLGQQCKVAGEALNKAGKQVTALTRRYPIYTIAAGVALGFLIGRSRR